MLYNENWVYRCVYGCHYLMDIQTNTIVCISPILGELFSGLEPTSEFEMNFKDWCNSNGITTSENKETIIKSLIEKGILQYE